ncbi:MAG: T9SS type A sorting domain-containing protein [Ignavibacterium sp.]|nr:T9SS type A sorting domain-containing protein [Ignavibacterium sp.]
MKVNLLLIALFATFIAYSYSGLFQRPTELLGGTELNGAGCVCHTVERDTSVKVWIEGPDTLIAGQTGIYHMYLAGGPAQAGGYNVAGRFGTMVLTDSFSFWDYRSPNELTQAFPLVFPSTQDTIYWEFGYTASDSSSIDTLYSCGLSIVYDGIPDSLDRWNFGPKFPITILQGTIPVELISFTAKKNSNIVELNWTTATETNNRGFEIQRSVITNGMRNLVWEVAGFVNGNGTISEPKNYSFIDKNLPAGGYSYRLKQIDFDGSYKYSGVVEVTIDAPVSFSLEQNYPNPFNSVTKISWHSSVSSRQTIKLFDILGREIETIVDDYYDAGEHSTFYIMNSSLPSGIYLYQLTAGEYSETKKMLLLK